MPEGAGGILNARSLGTAHRRAAELLRPGMTVLDVGCGTGAITRGIAEAAGPGGCVVGTDVHRGLIEQARRRHADVAGLSFVLGDVYTLPFHGAFDLVTSARLLQWLAHPLDALRRMAQATKPGGRLVVLDYNHERAAWEPELPARMQAFYAAFLRWRADAGMENAIADHLAELFEKAGLEKIVATSQHEVSRRTDLDFETRIGIWAEVAASRGHQMVADGVVTEEERAAAEADHRQWARTRAESQTLYLVAVEGTRPRL
jgi:ubiquinone/menaquinone biosynthesis C-methylase UbiE